MAPPMLASPSAAQGASSMDGSRAEDSVGSVLLSNPLLISGSEGSSQPLLPYRADLSVDQCKDGSAPELPPGGEAPAVNRPVGGPDTTTTPLQSVPDDADTKHLENLWSVLFSEATAGRLRPAPAVVALATCASKAGKAGAMYTAATSLQQLGLVTDSPAHAEWELNPEDLAICTHEDGALVSLGAGAFGKVRPCSTMGVIYAGFLGGKHCCARRHGIVTCCMHGGHVVW